jgi:phosphatidylserine synthase
MVSVVVPAAFAYDAGLDTFTPACWISVVDKAVDGTLTLDEVNVNDADESGMVFVAPVVGFDT